MSDQSETPSTGNSSSDVISPPRIQGGINSSRRIGRRSTNPHTINMSGQVLTRHDSVSTSVTISSSGDDDNLGAERSSYVEKNLVLKQMRLKEREAKLRFERVWHSVTGNELMGNELMDPEKAKDILNTSTDSTMDSSFDNKDMAGEQTPKSSLCLKRLFFGGLVLVFIAAACSTPFAIKAINDKSSANLVFETSPPTVSIAPSITPSVSLMPSSDPSAAPSSEPSISGMPTETPSSSPSISMVPSSAPTESAAPSEVPSVSPTHSIQPSAAPTSLPSNVPTLSLEPTFQPVSSNFRFKLRLYWQQGYFWQESTSERYWCLECVRCAEYGRGDGWEHGCDSYDSGSEDSCREGDSLWIRDCRSRGARFNVLQKPRSGYLLRLDDSNLCIERKNKYLTVRKCDMNDKDQLWAPWHDFSQFELRALEQEDWGERDAFCVSQLHHPKSEELVGMHNCRLCRIYETRYWEEY